MIDISPMRTPAGETVLSGVVDVLPNSRGVPLQLTVSTQPAHEGGEASLYPSVDGRYVVKIYHRAGDEKVGLLEQIIHLGADLGMDARWFAWPLAIVHRVGGGRCTGVVTRRVPETHVPLQRLIASAVDAAAQFRQGRTWLDTLSVAWGIARAVRAIHSKGMAHADLHFKNVLVDEVTNDVVLIDLDGLVVRGFLPPQVKGMPGFMAPEIVMGKATTGELSDRHSLAVLLLWTLLYRNVMAPRRRYDELDAARDEALAYGAYACFSENGADRRNWIPQIGMPLFRGGLLSYRMLPPEIQHLAERALIAGLHDASSRPHAGEWEEALAAASFGVAMCRACRQSACYPYWLPLEQRACAFCGAAVADRAPAVLEVESGEGEMTRPARRVVLDHGRPLLRDAVELNLASGPAGPRPAVLGDTVWDDQVGRHRLVNTGAGQWTVEDEIVAPGGSVVLSPGVRVQVGPVGRVLQVVE